MHISEFTVLSTFLSFAIHLFVNISVEQELVSNNLDDEQYVDMYTNVTILLIFFMMTLYITILISPVKQKKC